MIIRIVIVAVVLFAGGCSMFSGSKAEVSGEGSHVVRTRDGTLVYRTEPSPQVEWLTQDVDIEGGNMIVSGRLRLKSGTRNPQAVVNVAVFNRAGTQESEFNAVLADAESDRVLNYRVRFGLVPPPGRSLVITYQDWSTLAGFAGGSGSGSVVSGPGAVRTGQSSRSGRSGQIRSAGGGKR